MPRNCLLHIEEHKVLFNQSTLPPTLCMAIFMLLVMQLLLLQEFAQKGILSGQHQLALSGQKLHTAQACMAAGKAQAS